MEHDPAEITADDLKEFGALAHPIRMQILQATAAEPLDAKAIAKALNVKPTRLYRHLDHLERVGLLEVVSETTGRGLATRLFRARKAPDLSGEASTLKRLGMAQTTLFVDPDRLTGLLNELISAARFQDVRNGSEVQLTITVDQKPGD